MSRNTFEITIPVEPGDIDHMGHVNNIVYLRWVQDVAAAHWQAIAPAAEQAQMLWIILRHEIDYLKSAVAGDRIIARTWVGTSTRIRFERHTELLRERDGTVLAKARTMWCPIDPNTGRPVLVTPEVRALFSVDT